MNDKFDELAKNMAQSVTRRQALRRFCVGGAGLVLAALGLARPTSAAAAPRWYKGYCQVDPFTRQLTGGCVGLAAGGDPGNCPTAYSPDCVGQVGSVSGDASHCYAAYDPTKPCGRFRRG